MCCVQGSQAILIASALSVLAVATNCSSPGFIDKECIKGRLSQEQAEAVHAGPWGHLPTYNRDAEGKCVDCVAAEDRIFAARCSNFIKKLSFHD
jgi:hypothetical protein